ncbi:MAG: hypothetical protein QM770_10220 [Tepidisphaeraceae bacterium]
MDKNTLPLFIGCDIRWGFDRQDSTDFALHVLCTLFLEWWQKIYHRPRSDLLRLGILGDHTILDDLHPQQKRFVQLYSLINATRVDLERRRSSVLGASVVAKAESSRDEAQTISRGSLLPSEVSAILADFADIISKTQTQRVIVHLDEVELIGSNRGNDFYSVCLELFNPVGVQFVVTGTPTIASDQESLLTSFETALELEGLDTVAELKSMIVKYSAGERCRIDDDAIDVLYEFFGGHPRSTLAICADAVNAMPDRETHVTARQMTKACLDFQRRLDATRRLHGEVTNRQQHRTRDDTGR